MKKSFIDSDRAVVADDQSTEVAEPGEGAFHLPTASVAAQRSAILRARLASIPAMRGDQFDAARPKPSAKGTPLKGRTPTPPLGFLACSPAATSPGHVDRSERLFRQPD